MQATKANTAAFKAWAQANSHLAHTVALAQAFAQTEKARVDAYILPLFATYEFHNDEGEKITNLERLYRCDDEALVAKFYAECDVAHRAHGFTGEYGCCPALVADWDRIQAENALLDSASAFFGNDFRSGSMETRKKALHLLMSACLHKQAA